jgi:Nucleoside 2-deoxyribosyltransferase
MQNYIYQAGPLFTEAEQDWHKKLMRELRLARYSVIWAGDLLSAEAVEATGEKAFELIFDSCKSAIDRCTYMLALLDGSQVDDGTAWEIGYAYAKGLPIYGIRTDFRQSGDTKFGRVNSMIEGCLTACASDIPSLIQLLADAKDVSLIAQEAGKRGY